MFTLDQLRGFVAVAEELHFGRAAERLQMTQPPLSRSIQKLERAVGAQLLERDNRNVELTTAGAVFLSEARRLLGLADGAVDQARRIQAGSAGTVRIGFTATATFGVLTALLDLVGSAFPEIASRSPRDGDQGADRRPPRRRTGPGTGAATVRHVALRVPPAAPRGAAPGRAARARLAQLDATVAAEDLANEPLIMYAPDRGPLLLRPASSG